jgi:hypothetical protein
MVNKFADFPFASVNVSMFSFWWVVGFYLVFASIMIWRNNLSSKSEDHIDIKRKTSDLNNLFDQFSTLPNDVLIDNPDEFVYTGFELVIFSELLLVEGSSVVFTRRTLKHLAEKRETGRTLLTLMPIIISQPDVILKNRNSRFLLVKLFPDKEEEPNVVVVERVNEETLIIITSFVTDKKYLKNFEILWRTGTSFS